MNKVPTHPMQCYVLVSVESGGERTLKERLLRLPEVLEVTYLFGEYPLLVKLQGPDEVAVHAWLEREVYGQKGVLGAQVFVVAPES